MPTSFLCTDNYIYSRYERTPRAFVMAFSNLMVICGMRVQGHGLLSNMQAGMSPKEAHDDMVNNYVFPSTKFSTKYSNFWLIFGKL